MALWVAITSPGGAVIHGETGWPASWAT